MEPTVVRTITVFLSAPPSADDPLLSKACTLAAKLRATLEASNVVVQTSRIAFPSPAVFGTPELALQAAQRLDSIDIDYISLGTIHPSAPSGFHDPHFATSVFRTTRKSFITTTVTESSAIAPAAVHSASQIIKHTSTLDSSGVGNMRYAVLANVRPGSPFFPASYAHPDGHMSVALGIQAVSLLNDIPNLTEQVESRAQLLLDICKPICDVKFDFSFAPLPGDSTSTAKGIAKWAGCTFGAPGTLAAAATVTSRLDRANFPRAGFCGIMLPIAEDCGLGGARLTDLLTLSAVCGVGLDCVPIPGDTTCTTIAAIIRDVAALSIRLGNKQLTVRLMPVPGVSTGGMTRFDNPYLTNSPVIEIEEGGEGGQVDVQALRIRQTLI